MDFKTFSKKFKTKFLKFWRSDNTKISLLRDVLIAFFLVLLILTALWAYTGQWFGAPMVAIESGSMMHDDEPFGRIGTIDAGDMVLLVKVNSRNELSTQAERDPDKYFYWDYGDVIIYRPYGNENRDQIIHRARCWVEYHEEYGTYTVEEYGIYNESEGVIIPELGLTKTCCNNKPYRPEHSGYITKGDNNAACDQLYSNLCDEPIKLEWISGRASGELPWIGTINLFFNDLTSGKNTVGNVPGDSLVCLIILIAVLISIPVSLDIYDYIKTKNKEKQKIEKRFVERKEEKKQEIKKEEDVDNIYDKIDKM